MSRPVLGLKALHRASRLMLQAGDIMGALRGLRPISSILGHVARPHLSPWRP